MVLKHGLMGLTWLSGAVGVAVLVGCATTTPLSGSPLSGAGVFDPVEHKKMVERGKMGLQEIPQKTLGVSNRISSPEEEFTSCFHRLENDPNLSPLKGKIALTPKQGQSFDILTNNSKPTKIEKVAIRDYSQKALTCMNMLDTPFKSAPAEAREAFSNSKNGMQSLLASLYLGDITYGTYARSLSEVLGQESKAIAKAITEEQRQAINQANLKAQQEIERNRAISANQQARATQDLVSEQRSSNWLRALQGLQQNIYQPQSINCTSRQSFGNINTTCY